MKVEVAETCKPDYAHVNVLTTIARKIISFYATRLKLPSLELRLDNRPMGFEEFPPILQAFIFQQELSAAFNDIGHHRFDNFASVSVEEWAKWELSSLARELLGATRNHRVYAIERCYNQPFWRVTQITCNEAIQELLDLSLIESRSDSIYQTNLGRDYFNAANELAEEHIYGAWNHISQQEYDSFKETLEWLYR
ncbi:MAG: hypothetical protein R8G66_15530 [Cytophagales bacterium]|nr:hypothetical protein [Cytophagales bacterium]